MAEEIQESEVSSIEETVEVEPVNPLVDLGENEAGHVVDSTQPEPLPPKQSGRLKRMCQKIVHTKKISIPLAVVLLLGILYAVPTTRYKLLGLFLKKNVVLYTVDSKSKTAIFNTLVSIDGKAPGCGSSKPSYPNCFSRIPVGFHTVKVEAAYYQTMEAKVLVTVGKSKTQNVEISMVATGRPVSVRVTDKINGKVLSGVQIKAGNSAAVTNERGDGQVVVGATVDSIEIEISSDGYNTLKTKLNVEPAGANFNQISLVPAGKLYFLSKLSGKIDVVKTNLDGSSRQTVLSGTGSEQDTDTVLLASRDWKYLALKARREGVLPKLYLIDTATDKLSNIDEGDANFDITGWTGQNFVYTVRRNTVQNWQPKAVALKSYNATNKKITVIDENQATGDQYNYAQEAVSWVSGIGSGEIVYFKTWSAYHTNYSSNFTELNGKQAQLIAVHLDSSTDKKVIKSYEISAIVSSVRTYYSPLASYNPVLYEPTEIYFNTANAEGATSYAKLQDDKVSDNDPGAKDFFNQGKAYPTYLLSPSAKSTLWADARDGKNTLFTGNSNAENGKQIASLSEYGPYGWYSDSYILLSKKGSELYIMAADGNGTPIKVTDYHKPAFSYQGYGGGYGGL